jgi:hypothetical protein
MAGASHSGALVDLDLRFHDWRALTEQLPLAVYIDRLDEWSSNLYTSPQMVPGRSGQAGFHHGFLLDITERKALEAELAEHALVGRAVQELT